MTGLLTDPYYSQSHQVFRRATNQTELMLDHLVDRLRGRTRLSICSVGSGTGLFEVPMLARLSDTGIALDRFVGLDLSEPACAILESRLEEAAHPGLAFTIIAESFETFETNERFDVVLFNHVVEYLPGEALRWIEKSIGLLEAGGSVLMFSPTRGGINRPYEAIRTELTGDPPVFAEDIERILDSAAIAFAQETMIATCDISALDRPGAEAEKLMLLSFLTQRDCRELPEEARQRYIDYYRSLRPPGEPGIAHPTTLFVL